MKEDFLKAIDRKLKVKITFDTKEEGRITRICIPFDFGPSNIKNIKDHSDKYHVCDLNSPSGEIHPIPISPIKMVSVEVLDEGFDPKDYVDLSWGKAWHYRRDWGIYS